MRLVSYSVKGSKFGTEAEPLEDREVDAVDGSEAAGLRVVDVRGSGFSDVLLEPHGAQCLLQGILALASSPTSLASLFLVLVLVCPEGRGDGAEITSYSDDASLALLLVSLKPPGYLLVHIEGLCQEIHTEPTEYVVGIAFLFLFSFPYFWSALATLLLLLPLALTLTLTLTTTTLLLLLFLILKKLLLLVPSQIESLSSIYISKHRKKKNQVKGVIFGSINYNTQTKRELGV